MFSFLQEKNFNESQGINMLASLGTEKVFQ